MRVEDDAKPSTAFSLAARFASFSAALSALFALFAFSASLTAEPRRLRRERDDESGLETRREVTNRARMMRHETTSSEIAMPDITTLEILMREGVMSSVIVFTFSCASTWADEPVPARVVTFAGLIGIASDGNGGEGGGVSESWRPVACSSDWVGVMCSGPCLARCASTESDAALALLVEFCGCA